MEISLNFIEKHIHYKENFNIYFFLTIISVAGHFVTQVIYTHK